MQGLRGNINVQGTFDSFTCTVIYGGVFNLGFFFWGLFFVFLDSWLRLSDQNAPRFSPILTGRAIALAAPLTSRGFTLIFRFGVNLETPSCILLFYLVDLSWVLNNLASVLSIGLRDWVDFSPLCHLRALHSGFH